MYCLCFAAALYGIERNTYDRKKLFLTLLFSKFPEIISGLSHCADTMRRRTPYSSNRRSGPAEMQSRVQNQHEFHQRRLTAARLSGSEADRQAFLSGLLEDAELCQAARRSFLKQLQAQGLSGKMLALAEDESLCIVLRSAFRRLNDLLLWDAARASLPRWWGLQATFEFNNDGRRQAERASGFWRSTGETYQMDAIAAGDAEAESLELPDADSDPAVRYERRCASFLLTEVLRGGGNAQAASWLQEWLNADALHSGQPLVIDGGGARLVWRYGAQGALAAQQGISARTLRTRSRQVEQFLLAVARQAQALPL